MSDEAPHPDVLRIMVATDSHLGYMERDPVRGMDSFAAFDEVLVQAKHKKVDFVLLGGDLFHENKPSRRTLYRTMDILRNRCMGPEPVSFQIISEQAQNFKLPMENVKERIGHVNYEDPFVSVGLPIFSIHGNHDDPTREGGVESLAALDLLHVANLVNYFGKSNKVDDVEVNPILIQKGKTKLALYGMGSMRDERLNRMWHQKKVKFLRPLEDDSGKDFFNVFVLHQNRVLGRGKKNCIHESMIPEWMDLVLWGHEHECQIEPAESLVGTFRITQPGSSVATSLCEGEAVRKQVGILEIKENDFRLLPLPLSQVRPFLMEEIVLGEVERLDATAADVDDAVGLVLAERIEGMIKQLHDDEEEEKSEPPEGQQYLLEKRDQVLVRLKVEHSDFPTLNNQRFGSQFMGKVANPSDLLLFYRRRNAGDGGGVKAKGGGTSGLSDPILPESLDDVRVEDLVMENLENADRKLSLLVEGKLKIALEDFVGKGQKHAMNDLVKESLESAQKVLRKEKAAGTPAMIDDAVAKISDRERAKLEAERIRGIEVAEARSRASTRFGGDPRGGLDDNNISEDGGDGNSNRGNGTANRSRSARGRAPRPQSAANDNRLDDDDDDFADEVVMPAPSPPDKNRPGARGAGRQGRVVSSVTSLTGRGRGSANGASSGGGRRREAAQKPATPLDLVDPADDDDLSDIDEAPTHRQPVEPIDLSDEEGDHAGTTSRRNRDGVGKKRQKTGVAVGRTQEKKAALASRAGGSVSGRISAAQRHTRHKGSYKEEDLDDYDDEVDDAQLGDVGGGGRGDGEDGDDSFSPEDLHDDDGDDDASVNSEEFHGRKGTAKSHSRPLSSRSTTAAGKTPSRRASAVPATNGKKRMADALLSKPSYAVEIGSTRKRRSLQALGSAASTPRSGREDDSTDDIASEVVDWGRTR